LQQRRERPEDVVGIAARGPRHDHLDRTVGISGIDSERRKRGREQQRVSFHFAASSS
jgi:hypothetical protein